MPIEIALHEPEIPNNTGTIGRTCVALGCTLHLIHPLGFDVSDKACRRAGLDYWPRLDVREHADWAGYQSVEARRWLFTARGGRPWHTVEYQPGDHLVFGKETAGLPAAITEAVPDSLVMLPMVPGERSLNLSNCVAAAAYEAVRQMLARDQLTLDEHGRLIAASAESP